MKFNPAEIPEDLILRAANAMQGVNAMGRREWAPWEECDEREREHWLALAKAALIAISIHVGSWPLLKDV